MNPRRLALAAPLALLALGAPVRAEVSRFEVLERARPALEGRAFGEAGTAEKITARATIAVDPADPHNRPIVDLDQAPRAASGRVEAVADVVILRPDRPNGTLLVELPNRGRKLAPGWFGDTDAVAGSRLERAEDAGSGFLLAQGYTLAWVGWQGDIPPGGGMRIEVPTVAGLAGPSREEWSFADRDSPKRVALSYPAADRTGAVLTMRDRADDPPRRLDGPVFLDDRTVEIARPPEAAPDALYELAYTARDPKVMGLGLLAVRDVAAFLRRDGSERNPLARGGETGIRQAIALGISQSGRVLRDLLYHGLNEDEAGRIVFEGAMPLIPGARRSFTNARFAQPGRNPGPRFDRLYPVLVFPFTYAETEDPVTGRRDGLLARCAAGGTCPRIVQMDSEYEFWGSQASLTVTDPAGRPVALPANVRAYLLTGSPHSAAPNATAARDPGCALPTNPIFAGPAARALLTALNRWITDGTEPPASRYPTLGDGTLVPADQVYPAPIPGLPYRGQHARAEAIEQAAPRPVVRGSHPLFLPRAGADGNAVAGLRLPAVAAPRATYTGWNPIAGAAGPQDLCNQAGGALPLIATRAERLAAGDPRPSLEELYPGPDAYPDAVRAAADRLVADGLMLPEDRDRAVAAARDGTLARLGR